MPGCYSLMLLPLNVTVNHKHWSFKFCFIGIILIRFTMSAPDQSID